ncbi:MAG TPA: ferritin-like domain-containing protein [Phycisphaerae bacterium]|jgi:bacterioferritin|nr:ferritin [Phycisphaerae bacterium]HOB74602.1 ferritin-like domain-containing protein [Phycisphaerae bacterium]HOJ53557.1 ferritin-like domain-containing protein [Phycisphaerae bacterium]HOL25286.1 ferritin-like domain-containing protein [Phycisphaerae bacterium]HPP20499.1 ferritin-like domain-containing protein [Phycisphaerae bacterium]
MDKAKVIEKLNQAIALELGAVLQYNQYAHVLLGPDRKLWYDFFKDNSDEALDHARTFASRVVALGGIPSAEPEPVKQAADIREMLSNSLEVERRAVALYTEALALCEDHPGYRNLLEDQIQKETEDVEELEKYLNQVSKVTAGRPGKRMGRTA